MSNYDKLEYRKNNAIKRWVIDYHETYEDGSTSRSMSRHTYKTLAEVKDVAIRLARQYETIAVRG